MAAGQTGKDLMKLKHSERESPDINLTPLIDVVFLLLIFFMVSTTFNRDSELGLELPEANQEAVERPADTIEISVDAQGRYYVNGRRLVNTQLATLKQAIGKAAGEAEEPPIIVSADAKTPHQAVIVVMDAVQQLGFSRMSFATQVKANSGN